MPSQCMDVSSCEMQLNDCNATNSQFFIITAEGVVKAGSLCHESSHRLNVTGFSDTESHRSWLFQNNVRPQRIFRKVRNQTVDSSLFFISQTKEIRNAEWCLGASDVRSKIIVQRCDGSPKQQWTLLKSS